MDICTGYRIATFSNYTSTCRTRCTTALIFVNFSIVRRDTWKRKLCELVLSSGQSSDTVVKC